MIPRLEKVIEAFREAGRDLGIDVVAPFDLVAESGRHRFLAFIPHFGGSGGMVVAEIDSDRALYRVAEKAGYYISFVNADAYELYDRIHFIDTLRDWGFYGPSERQPSWWRME
jgi:hypothetical protein